MISTFIAHLLISVSANSWLFGGFVMRFPKVDEVYHSSLHGYVDGKFGRQLTWDKKYITGDVDPDAWIHDRPFRHSVDYAVANGIGISLDPDLMFHSLHPKFVVTDPFHVFHGGAIGDSLAWVDSLEMTLYYNKRREEVRGYLFPEEETERYTFARALVDKFGQDVNGGLTCDSLNCESPVDVQSTLSSWLTLLSIPHLTVRDSQGRWFDIRKELTSLNVNVSIVDGIIGWYRELTEWKSWPWTRRHGKISCENETTDLVTEEGVSCLSISDSTVSRSGLPHVLTWNSHHSDTRPTRIPIVIHTDDVEFDAVLTTGVIGSKYDSQTNTISPSIGWYVTRLREGLP